VPRKTTLVMLTHPPHGTLHFLEGLRAAMGLASSIDECSLMVAFLGDGCLGSLAALERGEAEQHIATLTELGCRLQVERESLDARSIADVEVAPGIDIIPRSDLVARLRTVDFVVGF
jgi:sulfur relay (sulfurtransferase) DsrF/TusC family protein